MEKNDTVDLEIVSIAHDGNGVGRRHGMAVFVPLTALGDRARVRVVKVLKRHAYGIVEELLEPSSQREENRCPVYRQCGGCSLRHLTYEAELAVKADWVRENLRRIGGLEPEMEPIIPSPLVDRYRNKAQYPIRRVDGRVRAGFFARRSHRLVPVEDCLLQPEGFREIVRVVTAFIEERSISPYDEENQKGLVRHLFIRRGEATGEVMVWLVVNGATLPHWEDLLERLRAVCPALASFGIDRNRARTNVIFGGDPQTLWGKDRIADRVCGVELALSPLSFHQVNRQAAELLFAQALCYADPAPEDQLLDLYCGAGAVGLTMAHRVGSLTGVEVVGEAVADAEANARTNGIHNARFLHGDAAEAARVLREEGYRPDLVVLDPPRKGVEEAALASLRVLAPRAIVYISCNSATLARDGARLAERGYKMRRARPVDLFPRTANVECCALFEKTE